MAKWGSYSTILLFTVKMEAYYYFVTYWHKIGKTGIGESDCCDWLTFKFFAMLYLIAIILLIGWLLGFFVFSAGSVIHILLVIAIIAILLRLIRGDRAI